MKQSLRSNALLLGLAALTLAFLPPLDTALAEEDVKIATDPADKKFAFSLADLGTGARPDADGVMRPIGYEYCIPKTPEAIMMVGNNDPTGVVHTNRATTIQCAEDELPVTGNTGQPEYLAVMRKIAGHDFVKKIILVENP